MLTGLRGTLPVSDLRSPLGQFMQIESPDTFFHIPAIFDDDNKVLN
jgi:hypothetical protein